MKREILFRGKRIDNGEWIYGDLRHIFNYGKYEPHIVNNSNGKNNDVCGRHIVPESLGKYTGLTDKNGEKIFEGDIIRHYKGSEILDVGVINYDEDHCVWYRTSSKSDDHLYIWKSCVYEVIGNIHDNPELLKGETNE